MRGLSGAICASGSWGGGHEVVALDNLDPFYDPGVMRPNLAALSGQPRFRLVETDILDAKGGEVRPRSGVVRRRRAPRGAGRRSPFHRAAAGVREENVEGTMAILELARSRNIPRFVFGSSLSVYSQNPKVPFSEADAVGHPISPDAAKKRAGELLCHTYHHLHGLSVVCLRLCTVYGPRQRPDLAIHKFARAIRAGRPIQVYGDGRTERDYTHVDDILQGIEAAIRLTEPGPPIFEIVNLGESETTSLVRLVEMLGEYWAWSRSCSASLLSRGTWLGRTRTSPGPGTCWGTGPRLQWSTGSPDSSDGWRAAGRRAEQGGRSPGRHRPCRRQHEDQLEIASQSRSSPTIVRIRPDTVLITP